MTRGELRAYVEDPARMACPLAQAVRELLADHDELRKKHAKFIDNYPALEAMRQDLEIARAHLKSLQRDNQRLRGELSAMNPGPWEIVE